jgi:DNA-binding transcriptional ArsR family regulator
LTPPAARIKYNLMVVDIARPDEQLSDGEVDRLFHALADATRRDILRTTLGGGEHNVSALTRRYPMSFAAVQKHVAVLAGAGLVTKERRGREQLVRGNPAAIEQARALLDQYEAVWRGRIDRIGELLADDDPTPPRDRGAPR